MKLKRKFIQIHQNNTEFSIALLLVRYERQNVADIDAMKCDLCFVKSFIFAVYKADPDTKVHGANVGPTWVLSVPDGLHIGPMNLAIRGYIDN